MKEGIQNTNSMSVEYKTTHSQAIMKGGYCYLQAGFSDIAAIAITLRT
jgi:hypothetical protein